MSDERSARERFYDRLRASVHDALYWPLSSDEAEALEDFVIRRRPLTKLAQHVINREFPGLNTIYREPD